MDGKERRKFSGIAGHSRSKTGVASLIFDPGMTTKRQGEIHG